MGKAGRRTAAAAGFCFLFAVILLVTAMSIYNMAGNKDVLTTQMRRFSTPEYSGLPDGEYPGMGRMIALYLTGGGETFQYSYTGSDGNTVDCFSDHEADHMADCRDLIALAGRLRWYMGITAAVMLAAGVVLWKYRKSFSNGMLAGFGLTALICLAVLIWSLIDFDSLFTAFHRLAFTNDGWLLDTRTDMLIRLMPTLFFRSMGIKALLAAAGAAAACLIVALGIRLAGRFREEDGEA